MNSTAYALFSTLYSSDSKGAGIAPDDKSVDTVFRNLKQIASSPGAGKSANTEEAERAIEILINIAASAKSQPQSQPGSPRPKTLADRAVEVLKDLQENKSQQVPAHSKAAIEQQVARLKALVASAQLPKAPKSSGADSKHGKSIHDSFVKDLFVPPAIHPPLPRGLADKGDVPLGGPSSRKDSKREVSADACDPAGDGDDAIELQHMTAVGAEPLTLAAKPSDKQALELQDRVKSLVEQSASSEAGHKPGVMLLNIEGQDGKPVRSIAVVAVSSRDGKGDASSSTRTDFAVLTYGVQEGGRRFQKDLGDLLKLISKTPNAEVAHLSVGRPAEESADFHADVCEAIGALDKALGARPPTVKDISEILREYFFAQRRDAAAPADPPVVKAPSSSSSSSVPAPVNTEKQSS